MTGETQIVDRNQGWKKFVGINVGKKHASGRVSDEERQGRL